MFDCFKIKQHHYHCFIEQLVLLRFLASMFSVLITVQLHAHAQDAVVHVSSIYVCSDYLFGFERLE